MVEEQVDAKFFPSHLQRILAADKCEANTQLQEEAPNVIERSALKFTFLGLLTQREKIKIVRVLHNLLG